ncbi:MMPL family transporter [Desulfuromonas soudanensis]|nr:MMPL family transporter [Desulfuromonas soudanensis]
MMDVKGIFASIYRFFSGRRRILFAATLLLLLASVLAFQGVHMEEDIAAMLPDDGSSTAIDFQLLQRAPLLRKIVIDLEALDESGRGVLTESADRLAAALSPPLFSRVVTGPGPLGGQNLLPWLSEALPSLLTEKELETLTSALDESGVDERLAESYRQLLSPEGWALKGMIRSDPFAFYRLGLNKLRHGNLIPRVRLDNGHFLSADGLHSLLIVETPVSITDSEGAGALLAEFETAARSLPPSISATLVSGHRYTLANAGAIKKDLVVILSASTLALIALFFIYLRHWRAVFVFAVPFSVLCLAAVAVSLVYPSVSAVTIGFGAVLLGISVDYALHVYFSLRHGGGAPDQVVGEVARPVVFGGLTTVAAFAVLLFSDLPGQRQLAVFAIVGLTVSLLLSLVVLPHLVPSAVAGEERLAEPASPGGKRGRLILFCWGALLLLSLWQGSGLRFNGDLRTLSLVPPELAAAEAQLKETWGDFRGKALIFAEGEDLQSALAANDRLFVRLSSALPPGEIVSLAPLLPSEATQDENRSRWMAFWQGEGGKNVIARLQEKAAVLGFAPDAFAPFLQRLRESPPPVTLEALGAAGLGELAGALVLRDEQMVRILSLVPDTAEVASLLGEAGESDWRLVSQTRFREEVGKAIGRDFFRFILLASLAVTLLLVWLFRHPGKVLLALVPVGTGLAAMFGAMAALGLDFTLFNVVATVLVIGLSVDYGIFMVCKLTQGMDRSVDRAVLVSGLTTLAGFGALVLARHPALHSIGVTVLLGIGAAIPAALLVIPALYRREWR